MYYGMCPIMVKKIYTFQPNVFMLGLSPEACVLRAISSVRPSGLEQALLSFPFSDALKLLTYTQGWIGSGSQVELVCRVAMLVRIHHSQLTTTSSARATLTSLHPVIQSCWCTEIKGCPCIQFS